MADMCTSSNIVVRLSTDGIIQHHTVRLTFTCSGALNTAMHDGNFVVVSKSVIPMHTQENLEQDLLTLTPVSGLNTATANGQ
jgi:hypothetical protein